jgi:hypothetical protein
VQGDGSAQIVGNTITFNQSTQGRGAGIALLAAGTPLISGNTIRNNTATTGLGGGIFAVNDSTLVISGNLIEANQAAAGGGLYSIGGAILVNNTIANNGIQGQPNGAAPQVYVDGPDSGVQFFNNILADRTGQGAVFCGNSLSFVPSFTNNDVVSVDPNTPGQPLAAAYTGTCNDSTGVNGNIQQDPLFVNGFASIPDFSGDFHLQAGSPAIDAGLNTAPNIPSVDLDGNPRIATGSAINCFATVDMGAYEFLVATNGIASLFPTNITFGSGQIGLAPNTSSLTLSATQGCIQVRSIKATGDYRVTSNCNAMFTGQSCNIQVSFAPTTPGIRVGSLVVDMGPGTPPLTASFTGEGVNSGSVSPTSLNFGTLPLQASSSPQQIQVLTAPGVPMQINGISITGDFSQFNSCSGPPTTGIACFINVTFSPTAPGVRTGTLTINTSQGIFAVPLTGNGATPIAALSPATVVFPTQALGSTSTAQTFTLSNDGTADLFINSVSSAGDFQVVPAPCFTTLSPGTICTFSVTFTPSVVGPESGVLQVDTNGGLVTAALSGTGTPAIATLSPQLLTFNPQPLNTSSDPQTITLTNISGLPLPLVSISAPDNFFATSNCPATLDTNAGCTITVMFDPSSSSPDSGFLSVVTSLGTVTASLAVNHRTIRVPTDAFSISQAVIAAQDGDTVLVAPGTYFEQINFLGKAITIASTGGPAATILDGGGFSTPFIAGLQEGPRSVLRGFTITHGSNGGITIGNASPTIDSNIITANTGCNGGGVELFSSSAVLTNNIISNNSIGQVCGSNAAGGGIQVNGVGQNGPVQITGNTITGNQVPSFQGGGGGIAVMFGTAIISGNIIQNNFSNGNGGGIWVPSGSVADVIQNLITGNSANAGGGIYHTSDFFPAVVLNNTITGNSASAGSAAYFDGFNSGVNVMDNLLIDDTGLGAVACGFSSGQIPSFSFNDVLSPGQPNMAYTLACPDQTGVNGNIKQDPQFVDPNGDYHLSAGSPAIDTGNPFILQMAATIGKIPALDLDGKTRIGPSNAATCNGTIDMGVYEFPVNFPGSVAPLPPSLDFGSAGVGGFSNTFNVPINAQGCVQIASIKTTGDFQQFNSCNTGVPVTSCAVQVTFAPTNSGLRSGTLTIDFGSTSPAQTVVLTGQGEGASLFASPSSLQFADQALGTSSVEQPLTIIATSQQLLKVNTIWINGDFSQTNSCAFTPITGNVCNVNIVFTPTASGPRTGALVVSTNQGTITVPISGNGLGATISPSSLAFADQPVNTTSAAQIVTLTNNSATRLQPQQVTNAPDFSAVAAPECSAGLNPGQSCTYSIFFTPLSPGFRNELITILTDGGGSFNVNVSGTGLGSLALVSPQVLNFPGQALQTTTVQTVSLVNAGTTPLTIASIATGGDFSQNNNCGASLAVGTGCTINVSFTPTAVGPRTATLSVATDAGNLGVNLSGTGLGGVASVSPGSVTFPDQRVQSHSTAQSVSLTNAGNASLTIGSISVNGDFFATSNCSVGSALAAGASCSISVTFTPTAIGARSGVLSIFTNSGNANVSLSGNGLGAVASVSAQSLSFAAQVLQTTSAAQPITLANTGNLSLSIGNIAVTGDFAQTNNCGQILAAGTTCTINTTFTPTAIGTRSGSLSISTTAGFFSIPVSGTGAFANAVLAPQTLALGSEFPGSTSNAQVITLTAGVNPLQIGSITASGDFAQTNNCPATLAIATSCAIQVTFTPTTLGARSGVLTVTSNEGSLTASLAGTGIVRDPNALYVPADQPTIQAGINAAATGQTVLVFPGTYAEHINFNGKAITLASTDGPAITTIDGCLSGIVVNFSTGEGPASVLRGFTVTRGTSTFEGSGILIGSTSPTIDGNVITANQGCGGIGIGIQGGSPTIKNNTISNNKQTTCSGGHGGGIEVLGGSPQILNNVITGNQITSGGNGGGIGINGGAGTIAGNIIRGNSAFNDGGGISLINNSPVNIIENLITGNTSVSGNGGGLYLGVPSGARGPFVVSNTVAGNAAAFGSAAFVDGFPATTKIIDNIFVGSPGAVALECSGLRSSTPPLLSFNDAFSVGGTGYDGTCAALAGTAGNISLDPQFVNAANNDFRLQAASPAIDAGNNSDPNLPSLDLDSNPRIAFGNAATCVNTVDLGAYEFSLPPGTASVSPSSSDFGLLPVGSSSPAQAFTVTAAQGCVKVDSVAATGDFSQTNNCSSILATGASCTAQVTFTPTAGGLRNGSLNVQSGNSTLTANLTGTGGVATATLSPTALSFGSQLVGSTSAAQAVALSNTGNIALTIANIAVNGDFAQSNTCGTTLAPGAACTISITFTPAARFTRTGSLTVQSNSTPSAASVSLSGTGIAPVATLTASLSFAPQVVGTTSTQTATLANAGDAPLTISSISATGDFTQSNNCPATLAAGSSCAIQVRFTPSAAGPRSGALAVSDSDPASATQTAALSGTGLDYQLSASPASASVRAGSAAHYTVTATAVGGNFPGAVSLSCSGLPTGATCAFSPASVSPASGSASSSLQLSTSNGQHGVKKTPSGTYTITIKGTSGNLSHTTLVTLVVQ